MTKFEYVCTNSKLILVH